MTTLRKSIITILLLLPKQLLTTFKEFEKYHLRNDLATQHWHVQST